MPELEIHISRIQEKLQQLLKQHQEVQRENAILKKDLEKSKGQMAQHQHTIDSLKQQVEILKVNSGNWDQADKKELEKRINLYIKEIDKCIAMLGE